MQRSIKFLLVLALVSFVAFSSGSAWAVPTGGGPGGHGKNMQGGQEKMGEMRARAMDRMIKDLNLSKTQETELRDHQKAHREQARALFEKMRESQEKLAVELEKVKTDRRAIKAISKEMKKTQADLVDHRINGVLKVKEILTPEQFKEFSEKISDLRKRGRKGDRKHKGRKDRYDRDDDKKKDD